MVRSVSILFFISSWVAIIGPRGKSPGSLHHEKNFSIFGGYLDKGQTAVHFPIRREFNLPQSQFFNPQNPPTYQKGFYFC